MTYDLCKCNEALNIMTYCPLYCSFRGNQLLRSKTCGSRSEEPDSGPLWSSEELHINSEYWHFKSMSLKVRICIYGLMVWSWVRVLRMKRWWWGENSIKIERTSRSEVRLLSSRRSGAEMTFNSSCLSSPLCGDR